jgi:O-antigen/teichoic acid export membrane protein
VVITQYASAILRGDGKYLINSFWQIKQRIVSALLITTFALLGFVETWQLLIAWAIGSIFINFYSNEGFWYRPRFQVLVSTKYNIYKSIMPLLLVDLMTAIYLRSDMILLNYYEIPNDQIGEYAAAYRLIEAVIWLVNAISITLFWKVRLFEKEKRFQIIFSISKPNDFSMRWHSSFVRNYIYSKISSRTFLWRSVFPSSKPSSNFSLDGYTTYTKCNTHSNCFRKKS